MVWPDTALPVVVEIAPGASGDPSGAAYVDVTTSARIADLITIEEGRGDWGDAVDPGKCGLTFNNETGDFSEHNPLGQWYGLLGKDTPLRVGLRRVEDAFNRTLAAGWGTTDSDHVWSAFGAGGTVLTTDQTVSGGKGRQSVPATAAYRASWLPGLQLLDCRVRLSGVSLPFTDVTGGPVEPGNILLRAQDLVTYYLARVEVTTTESVVCRLFDPAGVQLASATVPGLTHSAAQTLEVAADIAGDRLAMKVWATGGVEPAAWAVTATDDSLALPGGIGVRTGVALGNTNTLPVVASYESVTVYADLFGGLVPEWPPASDKSGKIRTVPIKARGVLSRLKPASGKPAERSPMRRTIGGAKPLAYWPGEDGVASGQVASAIAGHPPMTLAGSAAFVPTDELNFAAASPAFRYGSKALVDLAAGSSLSAVVPSAVTAATATKWTVMAAASVAVTAAPGDVVLLEWTTPGGTFVRWQLVWVKAALSTRVIAYDAAGTPTTVINRAAVSAFFQHHDVSAVQSGGNINVGLYWFENGAVFGDTGSVAGTLAGVASVTANPTGVTMTAEQFPVGHLAVFDTPNLPNGLSITNAELSFDGASAIAQTEKATTRLARLCAEDGVPIDVPAATGIPVTMGAQPIAAPLALYRQCEASDGGILYERPFRLAYRTRESLYTQTPALALDAAAGHLAEAPVPDASGKAYRNRWEVKRINGSSAVAQSPEVDQGAIVYEESPELSLTTDDRLGDIADWNLHLTSGRELRWPKLKFNLVNAPQLLDAWLNCRIGSRITVAHPPADVAGQDIDVLLEGYTLTLGYKDFEIEANCSPAQLWDAGVYDTARYDAIGSSLNGPISAGTTTPISVKTAPGFPVWSTTAAPFDVYVAGERWTVTAVVGAASPQNFTVVRSVNGVVKAQASNTPVRLWRPSVYAL